METQRMTREAPLFLIGPRACGKTTLARLVARGLVWAAADTDDWLTARAGRSVAGIVEAEGWEGFRRREAEALRAVAAPRTVVATGGGIVLAPENRAFMREAGRVVYLEVPIDVLCRRLQASPQAAQRPSLTGRGLTEEVGEVLQARAPLYRETAHHCLDAGLAPERLAREVARLVEST